MGRGKKEEATEKETSSKDTTPKLRWHTVIGQVVGSYWVKSNNYICLVWFVTCLFALPTWLEITQLLTHTLCISFFRFSNIYYFIYKYCILSHIQYENINFYILKNKRNFNILRLWIIFFFPVITCI